MIDVQRRFSRVDGTAARPRGRPAGAVVRPEGPLDAAAARRVAAQVRARGWGPVTIDLRRALVEDVGLAALTRALADRPVAVLGLTRHHERLLRYLDHGREEPVEAEAR